MDFFIFLKICSGHSRVKERSESHPPLQPVDGHMVGLVGDVECRQTQVGEIPEQLWGKKITQHKIRMKKP